MTVFLFQGICRCTFICCFGNWTWKTFGPKKTTIGS